MKRPIYQRLYFQVLSGILIGVCLGHFYPDFAVSLQPLQQAFIGLIKMMIHPIIFCTIVVGIAKMGDLKEVGRVGVKALLYFEVVSTLALILGLIVVNLYQPGVGMNVNPNALDPSIISSYATKAEALSTVDFLLKIIPRTVVAGFTEDSLLPVLLFSVLFAISLAQLGDKAKQLLKLLDQVSHVSFGVIGLVMKVAPLGACGAMAFTVGKYGFGALVPLGKLVITFGGTCIIFILFLLGPIFRVSTGFGLLKFLKYIKEEIFLVLGTSSSEAALPRMIAKLENLGCAQPVVGLVIPTGYSFNLDGTNIYLSIAAIFIAQATNTDLSMAQQLSLLAVLMLTSKGAAGVSGSGFIVLASTLSAIETLPVAGLALIVGIDMFMSTIRAVTNVIGNGVATVVVSKWEKALDNQKAQRVLDGETEEEADLPEKVADENMNDDVKIEKAAGILD